MRARQFDLFTAGRFRRVEPSLADPAPLPATPTSDDDAALIAAIPDAPLSTAATVAAEAARRRLVAAVPALEQLCQRFTGFGMDQPIPEQMAAVSALVEIGGREAAAAVGRLISRRVIVGAGLPTAIAAAARLGIVLPKDVALPLLRHADRAVRADACRCLGAWPGAVPLLVELLGDPDAAVRMAAACALGRMGRIEGRPMLTQLLRIAPSAEVIDAVIGVADEDCIVLLARVARTGTALAPLAAAALDQLDHPRDRRARAVLVPAGEG